MLRRAATVLTTVVLALGVAPSADAATSTVKDPRRDAPASIDVTRATYVNSARRIGVAITVRDLRTTGVLTVYALAPGTNDGWGFDARRTAAGLETRVFRYRPGGQVDFRRCKVKVAWKQDADTVRGSFPRSCTRGLPNRLSMVLSTSTTGGTQDFVRARTVRRG